MNTLDAPIDLWAALGRWEREQDRDAVGIIRRWLETDGDPSNRSIADYLRRLQDRGLKDGSVDQSYRTVRRFVAWAGLPKPRVASWRYDPEEADRPWFVPQVVAKLATTARHSPVVTDAARLCLASLYGMRVGEIAAVRPEDVRLEEGRVFIRSEKGSRRRWCWIPPEARPWLDVHWQVTTPRAVAATLDALWENTFTEPRPKGAAWHAVRRGVACALGEAGCREEDMERFLRWKSKSMARRYMHPNVRVTADGRMERVAEADEGLESADAAVWRAHSMRGIWA